MSPAGFLHFRSHGEPGCSHAAGWRTSARGQHEHYDQNNLVGWGSARYYNFLTWESLTPTGCELRFVPNQVLASWWAKGSVMQAPRP